MRALIYMKGCNGVVRCVVSDGDFSAFVRASLLSYEQRHTTLISETEQVELVDLVTRINQLDENALLKAYIEHLCPSMLAASQMSSKADLHDTIRFLKSSSSTKLALSCKDEHVTVMISDVRSDSEGSLQRDIDMFHRILGLLYGPCDYLLDTIKVSAKNRLTSELTQIFQSYLSLKDVDQTFWFDAIESIHLGDEPRLQVTKSLKNVLRIISEKAKSAQLLSGASKGTAEAALSNTVLLVDTKVGWLTSQPGAQDLAKSDLVLLTILAKSAFSGSGPVKSEMSIDNLSPKDSKNKITNLRQLIGKPKSLSSSSSTFDQPQLRRVHATVDCMSRPHSQPPGGRSTTLILDAAANANARIALTIPRTAADRVRDGPTEPDSVSSTLANWNMVDNDNASSQLDPSASSDTNEEELDGNLSRKRETESVPEASNNAASEVHFKANPKPRPHSYQNAKSVTGFEQQVQNESERKVNEKVRLLSTFVYRRVVQLQTLDCAYVPHEAYFVRVDESITLILLFRLPNAQLASSIYACAQLLDRMRLAQADVEQLLERSSAAGTNPNFSMSQTAVASIDSMSFASSNTVRTPTQGTSMRTRIDQPSNLSSSFPNGGLVGLSNTETVADTELPVEARSGLIREFEKAWKFVYEFARRLSSKRDRREDFELIYRVDNKDIRSECRPEKLTERWEQVKLEFYQRFYASRITSDRNAFSIHIEKLSESVRYVFQLAYLGEWAQSSEETVAVHVRRSASYEPLFIMVFNTIRADLSMMLDFLHVRAQCNICVTNYIENYQGMVFFGFVNRTTSHRISTSITIEPAANDREKDGRYDEHGYVRCSARRKDQIMNAINWYRDTLNATGARTNFGMMTRHGFKFTFYRFLEDANSTPLDAGSAEYDSLLKRALEDSRWAISHALYVKEFFSVHLSTVQSAKIVDHIRKILLNRSVELQV